jgi:hypothetical protein
VRGNVATTAAERAKHRSLGQLLDGDPRIGLLVDTCELDRGEAL